MEAKKGNSLTLPSADLTSRDTGKFRLVGKLISERKFNFKAIKSVLLAAWKFVNNVDILLLNLDILFVIFARLLT